jgi:hypothetical protein
MKSRWVLALLLAVLGAGVYAGNVLATTSSGLTSTILAKSLFDQFDVNAHTIPAHQWQARLRTHGQSDVYVVDNKLAPKADNNNEFATTGWHSHPGPSLVLVIAGTVTDYTSEDPTCTGHPYTAGTGFIDPGGAEVHMLRNESNTQPAETIAVQFLPKCAARRIDEPEPSNCHL